MIRNNDIPILEFDTDIDAKITAASFLNKILPEYCVISFFKEAISKIVKRKNGRIIGYLHSEIVDIPIYELDIQGKKISITLPFATAPGAAGTIEELHAMGAERFIVCGAAGCLRSELEVGNLILPVSAVRDEGTSYHYIEPSREVTCNPFALQTVKQILKDMSVPYVEGKTWTTDAFYRETAEKIERRVSEGCLTVEMECAAFYAVAKFYNLPLVQILYAGDNLDCEKWEYRDWNRQYSIRENIVNLALEIVGSL